MKISQSPRTNIQSTVETQKVVFVIFRTGKTVAAAEIVIQQSSVNTVIPENRIYVTSGSVSHIQLRDTDIESHPCEVKFIKCTRDLFSQQYTITILLSIHIWKKFSSDSDNA